MLCCANVWTCEANTQAIQDAVLEMYSTPCTSTTLVCHSAAVVHLDGVDAVLRNDVIDCNRIMHRVDLFRSNAGSCCPQTLAVDHKHRVDLQST